MLRSLRRQAVRWMVGLALWMTGHGWTTAQPLPGMPGVPPYAPYPVNFQPAAPMMPPGMPPPGYPVPGALPPTVPPRVPPAPAPMPAAPAAPPAQPPANPTPTAVAPAPAAAPVPLPGLPEYETPPKSKEPIACNDVLSAVTM